MARVRTPEKTLMIISIIISFVLVAGLSALCYMKRKKVQEVREETNKLVKEAEALQKKIDKLDEKREERDRLAAEIHEYEKILPDAKEVENLMTMLSDQGLRSDCSVKDFSLVEKRVARRGRAAENVYGKVEFECSISSSKPGKGYFCACKFLNLLERYERFIAVDDLMITGGKKDDTTMAMDVSAHTYMFTGKKVQSGAAKRGRAGAKRK